MLKQLVLLRCIINEVDQIAGVDGGLKTPYFSHETPYLVLSIYLLSTRVAYNISAIMAPKINLILSLVGTVIISIFSPKWCFIDFIAVMHYVPRTIKKACIWPVHENSESVGLCSITNPKLKSIVPCCKGGLPTNEPARANAPNENWVWRTANKFASHIQVYELIKKQVHLMSWHNAFKGKPSQCLHASCMYIVGFNVDP